VQAAVVANDPLFWEWSPNVADVGSALLAVAQGRSPDELPSPITSTLINQYLLPPATPHDEAETTRRQAQAWWLAWRMSGRYSKEQILEWHLNTRAFGRLARGPQAAAQAYFGKAAADLTLPEATLLASLANGTRTNADERGLEAVDSDPFEQMVIVELENLLGEAWVQRGGLNVYTSLDMLLQHQAECVMQRHREQLSGRTELDDDSVEPYCAAGAFLRFPGANAGQSDAAVLALDPISGQVRALVGDVEVSHEPGTLLSPFVYLTALSQGYNAATMVLDVETVYEQGDTVYRPQNEDGRFRGPLRLREALADGRIVPAVQVMSWVGPEQVVQTARSLGLAGLEREAADLSLLSGGGVVNLLDAVFAFATLDNLGVMVGRPVGEAGFLGPATIWRVTDDQGNILYDYQPQRRDILTPPLAYLMNDMLAEGATADRRPPAVEIVGETADGRNSWAVGYMPQLVIGIWTGYDSNGGNVGGNTAAAPLGALLGWAGQALPPARWERPPGLRELEVCDPSGLLPTADCPAVLDELFVDGTQPTTADTIFQPAYINRENGRLATFATPPDLVERRVYQVFPPEAVGWAREAGIPAPPTDYDTILTHSSVGDGVAAILEPEPFAEVSGEVVVRGTAASETFASYRLAYFPGLYPEGVSLISDENRERVAEATLGTWDTTSLDEGLYTVLLTVINEDGTFTEAAVPITVSNLP
jgi:membrane carboxypeptidase/penicillin-binding protein